jgi:hypothetical protein
MAAVSEVHEHVVPALHLSLRETRLELESMTDLARRLAEALDAHVDEAYGGRRSDSIATGAALHEARQRGLL